MIYSYKQEGDGFFLIQSDSTGTRWNGFKLKGGMFRLKFHGIFY